MKKETDVHFSIDLEKLYVLIFVYKEVNKIDI